MFWVSPTITRDLALNFARCPFVRLMQTTNTSSVSAITLRALSQLAMNQNFLLVCNTFHQKENTTTKSLFTVVKTEHTPQTVSAIELGVLLIAVKRQS